MELVNKADLETVSIDFEDVGVPASVKEFRPTLFKDGDSFCCLLGSDPQAGVFGCGNTAKAALDDWDLHLKERIKQPEDENPLDKYIQDTIAASDMNI